MSQDFRGRNIGELSKKSVLIDYINRNARVSHNISMHSMNSWIQPLEKFNGLLFLVLSAKQVKAMWRAAFWLLQKSFYWHLVKSRSSSLAHACNSSYSGGRRQEDHSSKSAQANSLRAPILKKPLSLGRVAQGVGPEFKPSAEKKKNLNQWTKKQLSQLTLTSI
jgi:hypothetical protein